VFYLILFDFSIVYNNRIPLFETGLKILLTILKVEETILHAITNIFPSLI